MKEQLLHCCVLHIRYLEMAVSLDPQFSLWANMPQYVYSKVYVGEEKLLFVKKLYFI
jgi:hypothetical protein